jgi:type IX secretion system PorP/SprF family membrane protein
MMRKLFFITIILLVTQNFVLSQDAQLTQFYNAPLYINPAYAGSIELSRVGFNQRIQWPTLSQTIETSSAYFDNHFNNTPHGIGFLVVKNQESLAKLSYTYVALQYSYRLEINDNWVFQLGTEGRFFQKDADFEELLFSDQIDLSSGVIADVSADFVSGQYRVGGLDLAAGGVLFSNSSWLGASVYHLTEPDDSFDGNSSKIPRFYSLHGGYKFNLKNGKRRKTLAYAFQERSISLAANYKQQSVFSQLDFGIQSYLEPVYFGLWYRGLPLNKLGSVNKSESIIFLMGVQLEEGINIGYSYDFTVSELRGASGGSHEISISLLFGDMRRLKKHVKLPCFYMPYR